MEEYKGNSIKSREETKAQDKNIKPVVRGTVKVKKEPISRKFAETFLSENITNVREYMINDVLIPAVRDTIVDLINNGTNMLAYGSSSGRRSSKPSGQKTSYTSYYRGETRNDTRGSRTSGSRHGYSDVIFETRGDAQEVIDCLDEVIDKYKMVSVADFYELANASEFSSYTDRNYGWYDLSSIAITRDKDGYRIKLPKAEPLD